MRVEEFASLAFCHHHDPNLYFNLAAPSAGKTSLWKIKSNLYFVSWSGYFYKESICSIVSFKSCSFVRFNTIEQRREIFQKHKK